MNYEFLRAISEGTIDASCLTEATFKEYKEEYDRARRKGMSRTDAMKLSAVTNVYRDSLKNNQEMKKKSPEKSKTKSERRIKNEDFDTQSNELTEGSCSTMSMDLEILQMLSEGVIDPYEWEQMSEATRREYRHDYRTGRKMGYSRIAAKQYAGEMSSARDQARYEYIKKYQDRHISDPKPEQKPKPAQPKPSTPPPPKPKPESKSEPKPKPQNSSYLDYDYDLDEEAYDPEIEQDLMECYYGLDEDTKKQYRYELKRAKKAGFNRQDRKEFADRMVKTHEKIDQSHRGRSNEMRVDKRIRKQNMEADRAAKEVHDRRAAEQRERDRKAEEDRRRKEDEAEKARRAKYDSDERARREKWDREHAAPKPEKRGLFGRKKTQNEDYIGVTGDLSESAIDALFE